MHDGPEEKDLLDVHNKSEHHSISHESVWTFLDSCMIYFCQYPSKNDLISHVYTQSTQSLFTCAFCNSISSVSFVFGFFDNLYAVPKL